MKKPLVAFDYIFIYLVSFVFVKALLFLFASQYKSFGFALFEIAILISVDRPLINKEKTITKIDDDGNIKEANTLYYIILFVFALVMYLCLDGLLFEENFVGNLGNILIISIACMALWTIISNTRILDMLNCYKK
ncbi:MAG: hypothetical protein Q4B60_03295 [Erysipelotrichaceae bacterium]|nr:hypothetical protein [Erysipelotrichaceae bacterium]